VTGTVTDQSHAIVSGATVSLTALSTGAQHSARTNAAGAYTLSALPVGRYAASFSAQGFDTLRIDAFTLEVGQTRTLNATLTVGAVSTTVSVEAGADLNQTSAEVGGVIQGEQTKELPVNGRYWASLMALIPGAIDSGSGGQSTIRFAGLSQEDNNFRFDGVDATGINHQFQKEPIRLQITTESIAEFRANSAVYSADQGGSPGGQVEVVSKTGTNAFHGSAYEFLRNDVFDARQFNAPSVSPFRLNNFGASLGGPAIRNKLFFFANYEGYRQIFYQQSQGNVPTDAYRASVIQKSPTLAPLVNAFPKGINATADPNALLWIGTGRSPTTEDAGIGRVDYQVSSNTSIFGRFNTDSYTAISPVGLGEQQATTLTTPNAVIGVSHTFSPTVLNDARVGFNRAAYENGGPTKLPFTLAITGFSSYGLPDPSLRHDNSFSFLDNATVVRGRHTVKFGVEVRRLQENKSSPSIPKETLSYLSESDFVNNVLDSDSYGSQAPRTGTRKTASFGYVLDEFKLRRNLTLNVGLRYEYFGVDHEVKGRGLVFDPFTCGAAYCPAGSDWYFPNTRNFSPRVSIAWAPEALHGKTVIRSGFGIFHGDGQFGALAALGNITYSYNLTQKNIPGLSYPVTPFLGAAAFSSSISGKDRHRKDVSINEWNFTLQQEVARHTTLQVAYFGSEGYHLFTSTTLNGIDPITGKRPYASATSSTIGYTTSGAVSNLNALQVGFNRSLATGLLVAASYQWSHSISDGSNGGGEASTAQNVNCRSCERASTDFDVRQNFSASAIWRIPAGRGHTLLGNASPILNSILGGWQLSGIGRARSGLPLNVTISRNASALPDGINASQRPDVVPGQSLTPTNGQTPQLWLNPYAFTTPANGVWGNAGRNLVRAPGIWQIDTALEKRIPIGERFGLSFRADLFNLLNRAQIGSPNVKWTDPTKGTTYGAITSAYTSAPVGTGTPRQMQMMIRLEF
jgi:hypothetical protein